MVIWAAAVGAFLGWLWVEFELWGVILGGLFGSAAGWALRRAVRAEVEATVARLAAELAPARNLEVVNEVAVPPSPPRPAFVPPPVFAPAVDVVPERLEPELEAGPSTPAESVFASGLALARDWLLGGNTVVRLGLVILFVGLSFLARYAAVAGLFPVELRLALVAAIGAVLLGIGFRTRTRRPAFGLALQGAGVAVIYLTLFGAVRLVPGFPVAGAFAVMVAVCAFGCALALLQRSQALAVTAFAGGFATPLLLSDGGGEVAGLFGYYTLLNLAILFIATRRAWRILNLLGFFATFGVASLWWSTGYTPADFVAAQAFLIASVLIYVAAAVLFAERTPGRMGAVVDTTLLFGPALAGFALEVALVGDRPFGAAFAALGFAALYLGVGAAARRRDRAAFRVLHDALLAIGVGFVTLAVPLALGARWTSAAWALEGAGAFWVGMRQARWLPRAFGLALQGVAGLVFLAGAGPNVAALPFANATFLGAMLIALAALLTAWWLRAPPAGSDAPLGRRYLRVEAALGAPAFLIGFFFWWLAWATEAHRLTPAAADTLPTTVFSPSAAMLLSALALVISALLWRIVGRRTGWTVATWPSFATLPVLACAFLLALAQGRHLLFAPDIAIWVAAIAAHGWMLWRNDRADVDAGRRKLLAWTHVGGVWLATAMLADCLWLGVDRAELWGTSWAGVVFLASVTAILLGLTASAKRAWTASSPSWPLDRHAVAYAWTAAVPIAVLTYAGALGTAIGASGETRPLPYLPLLNPVDLSVALAIAALALWRRTVFSATGMPTGAEALHGPAVPAALGALAFVALNTAWIRFAHQWLGIEWSERALFGSATVQTGLAILWTSLALALMVWAGRRGARALWLIGAGLIGLTVAKLLLVDLNNAGGGARIVAFMGVGALMLVVGYLAPLPPREAAREPDGQGAPA